MFNLTTTTTALLSAVSTVEAAPVRVGRFLDQPVYQDSYTYREVGQNVWAWLSSPVTHQRAKDGLAFATRAVGLVYLTLLWALVLLAWVTVEGVKALWPHVTVLPFMAVQQFKGPYPWSMVLVYSVAWVAFTGWATFTALVQQSKGSARFSGNPLYLVRGL